MASTNNMDPFDEFEFKPLTDGLGFHKKSVSLKEGLRQTGVLEDELQTIPTSAPRELLEDLPKAPAKKHTFEDVLSSLEKTPLARSNSKIDLAFTETLPREIERPAPMPSPAPVQSPFPATDVFKNPGIPSNIEFKKTPTQKELASVGTRRGAADSPKRKLIPATMSVASAALDLIIVSGLSLVFVVALLVTTKVSLNALIMNLSQDLMAQIALGVLFVAVMQFYVVVSRSFFGATLGEWTFDLQVGQDEEQAQESYPIKVVARSLLNILTGIVLLPLVSALIGRDVAGQISGVKLYRQNV